MNSRRARRCGRQIPEWVIISVVLSWSVTIGMPIAARLQRHSPRSSKVLWFFAGIGIGFLVLVVFCFAIGAAAWLLTWLWRMLARKK